MVEKLKTWLEIIRLGGLIGLFVVLVAYPASLKNWCNRGGFAECNIFGAKLTSDQKNAIQQGEQAVAESNASFNRTVQKLSEITASISEVSKSLSPEERKRLEQQVAQTQASVKQTQSQLQKSLGELSPLVQQVASAGNWAIVFGADKTLESAKNEIAWANQKGYSTARLYFRKDYFRSVIPFPNRATAQENLTNIQSRRRDAYIVNIDTWCPSKVSHPDYEECSAN